MIARVRHRTSATAGRRHRSPPARRAARRRPGRPEGSGEPSQVGLDAAHARPGRSGRERAQIGPQAADRHSRLVDALGLLAEPGDGQVVEEAAHRLGDRGVDDLASGRPLADVGNDDVGRLQRSGPEAAHQLGRSRLGRQPNASQVRDQGIDGGRLDTAPPVRSRSGGTGGPARRAVSTVTRSSTSSATSEPSASTKRTDVRSLSQRGHERQRCPSGERRHQIATLPAGGSSPSASMLHLVAHERGTGPCRRAI